MNKALRHVWHQARLQAADVLVSPSPCNANEFSEVRDRNQKSWKFANSKAERLGRALPKCGKTAPGRPCPPTAANLRAASLENVQGRCVQNDAGRCVRRPWRDDLR